MRNYKIRWADRSATVVFSAEDLDTMAARYDFDADAAEAGEAELIDGDTGTVVGWCLREDGESNRQTATDIIEAIAADLGLDASELTAEDRRRIRYGLEDGAALASLGFGDEDQEAVEEAHGMMQ